MDPHGRPRQEVRNFFEFDLRWKRIALKRSARRPDPETLTYQYGSHQGLKPVELCCKHSLCPSFVSDTDCPMSVKSHELDSLQDAGI